MTELERAALALAEALSAETACLKRGDYGAAIQAAPAKLRAIETFAALPRDPMPRSAARALQRVRSEVTANRAALDAAVGVQGRLVTILARALQPSAGADQYTPGHSRAPAAPVALSVQA
jgi:hypothetical protein